MKKILVMLALCFSVGNVFAQDADVNKLCTEGDAAMKEKNYPVALAKYSEFLKATNYEDGDRVFNCGYAAFNAKNYDEAIRFYDMAIKKGKNVDNAYVGKAMALRNLDKAPEFTSTVEEGLKVVKDKDNLEKLLYTYCMKQGQAAQKAGKNDQAVDYFNDVLVVSNPKYKGNALFSLGGLFYNNGAKILQVATPVATSDPDKYAAEKEKANAQFVKAQGYLEQALVADPANANAKQVLDALKAAMK